MGVIEECGMLVDQLRDDPAFVDELAKLRNCLTAALTASHPTDRRKHYMVVATLLSGIIRRLEAQR